MRHFHHHFGMHRGGRGLGRFGRGFIDDMGGRHFGMGRKLGSADLQLTILALIADKPRHGYEIIKALEERTKGFYAPSPGMVYPALTYLEEIGHATVELDGTRKRYQITTAGRDHLEANREAVDALFNQFDRAGHRAERVRRAMAADAQEAGAPGAQRWNRKDPDALPELSEARHALRTALAAKQGSPQHEQERIAAILRRAATEISASGAE